MRITMKYLISLLTVVALQASAQTQQAWVTRIGGPAACEANAVAVDRSGTVYAGGSWQGAGSSGTDMYLAKLTKATGDTIWTDFYRSANYDKIQAIALADSDIVAVGQSNNQYTVLHYWSDGTPRRVWRDTQHLSSGSYAVSVCTDETGAAYVTGNGNDLGSSYNIYTLKFSPAGDSLWRHTYAPANALADIAYDIAVDASHNSYVAGVSGSNILCIKLTAAGDTAWTRQYHGPASGSDAGYAVALDGEGNVYVAGQASVTGATAACIVSYTSAGTFRFAKTYTNPAKRGDYFNAVTVDREGNVIATGSARTSQYLQATLVAKYSSTGDSLWVQTYRPTTADASEGWRVAVDSAGTVYVAGRSRTGDYDITTVAYQPSGALAWAQSYSGSGDYDDAARDITVGDSGRVFVAGAVSLSSGYTDFTVICYTQIGTPVEMDPGALPERVRLMQNYPNPFNPSTTIRYEVPGTERGEASEVRLAVFDLLGREVALLVNERKAPGRYSLQFDGSGLAGGVYFYRLTAGTSAQTRRMLLLR